MTNGDCIRSMSNEELAEILKMECPPRLTEGSHWGHWCACDDDPELSCAELNAAVFGGRGPGWYWAPVVEDATSPVEPLNCWRAGNHG